MDFLRKNWIYIAAAGVMLTMSRRGQRAYLAFIVSSIAMLGTIKTENIDDGSLRTEYTPTFLTWVFGAIMIWMLARIFTSARMQRDERLAAQERYNTQSVVAARIQHDIAVDAAQARTAPAPSIQAAPSPLVIIDGGKRVRRRGETEGGVPIRDTRTVNPDAL